MMKKFCIAGIILLVLFSGCTKSPGTVTKDFIGAIQSNDLGKIQALSTDDTANIFTAFSDVIKEQIGEGTYTVAKEDIAGDTATVTIKTATGDEHKFDLVKINNEWKVTFKK
ncbi:MAG: DUF4878 domain-containing protein [Treponema sp.]|nr:DUF4878 domain-containing protein [Treponema sp.]